MNAAAARTKDIMRYKQEQADQRKVFVAFTESTMHLVVQLKREIAAPSIGMNHSGHGCACDAAHTCAAHAEAQAKLNDAYNALEAAMACLHKVVVENKR